MLKRYEKVAGLVGSSWASAHPRAMARALTMIEGALRAEIRIAVTTYKIELSCSLLQPYVDRAEECRANALRYYRAAAE